MKKFLQFTLISVGFSCLLSFYFLQTSKAQTTRLTIPEIFRYLNTQVPTEQFKSKDDVINFLIAEITNRKVDAPLTADIENIFRQVGATDALIDVIGKNNPTSPVPTPTAEPTPPATPTPTADTPVESKLPLTISAIIVELRKLAPDALQKDLIAQIELRKVSGTLNAATESILIREKATMELIEAIKKNLVDSTTPTPTLELISTTTPVPTPISTPVSTPAPTPVETPTPIETPTPALSSFTIPSIIVELRKLAPDASQKDLIAQIELRKVSGTLNAVAESILIREKATTELIETIKKNLVK